MELHDVNEYGNIDATAPDIKGDIGIIEDTFISLITYLISKHDDVKDKVIIARLISGYVTGTIETIASEKILMAQVKNRQWNKLGT